MNDSLSITTDGDGIETFTTVVGSAEFYRDDAGEWRWRIKARNGQTVADSGEGYANKDDAYNGMAVVRRVTQHLGSRL